MRRLLAGFIIVVAVSASAAGDASFQKDIAIVVKQGRGSAEGRAAWDRLVLADANVLPALLHGMNTKDTVQLNWLRTAFDQVVEREMKSGGKRIDTKKIAAFVKDPANEGRPRRLALDLLERMKPGTSAAIYRDSLDDPEFRYEAVALLLDQAKTKNDAKLYRLAFDKSRDMLQARAAGLGLKNAGIDVSVARHLGFLLDWHLVGPFDGMGQKGFRTAYLPETGIDLKEQFTGQKDKIRWKRFHVKESPLTSTDRHQALVNLASKDALGNADDAVAYAYTEIVVAKPMKAEMRGAADDNLTVWVNGSKVFGFEEWRNGVRHDRHRFPVELREGTNAVLVKVCQSAAPNPEPNWEFMLRVVDATGKGIEMK